ncbi:glutaredoxin family protein [Phocicoccus schoeneichii]|uniref:glutaredoxin family protein n=1 Tax=Phocicoccus schoeneichii TaxID=1812261 RepID=UPI003D13043D
MRLKLLMRNDCKLCDDAIIELKLALEDFEGVDYECINIDHDDVLQEEYMLRIPVVLHQEEIIQEGIIDFFTIHEYIDGYFTNLGE